MAGIDYEYFAANPEPSHSYLFAPVSAQLNDLPAGAAVLDLGCGNGTFVSLFQGRGLRLYGSDFSPTGIEIARKNFPGITFFLADASAPGGAILDEVGLVDAIISTEVIEHLYAPRSFVSNAAALLKPGGVLIMTTPYHGYLKNLLLAVTGSMDKHYTVLWDHGHIKFWSKATLRTLLREAGFNEIKFRGAGRLPWLWKSVVVSARTAGKT